MNASRNTKLSAKPALPQDIEQVNVAEDVDQRGRVFDFTTIIPRDVTLAHRKSYPLRRTVAPTSGQQNNSRKEVVQAKQGSARYEHEDEHEHFHREAAVEIGIDKDARRQPCQAWY